MERRAISSGTTWENLAGYSRLVQVGPFIYVSGTTAINRAGDIQNRDDVYGQAVYILRKIEATLQTIGAGLEHVVRTRVYVTNIEEWEQVTKAHKEFFDDIRPANTLVEVNRLADPGMLIEIEVDVVLPNSPESL
ncbi:MAG TPA: RidA family protein [Elainellaceae cyanobacterium]